ncbi:26S proteasome regulatory subunit 6B [Saguinus oedipus]|uniref:26S proteasome regulatory subunit 6B n=1 Tax=Saguinus oedipus TaxID=9490 RepID=A0ABQ9TVL0_SAGOE|nr:26S proteasome regulatory subunit 6B [Saguinus oedipus]
MEEIGILVEKAQDEIPALSVSRPQTSLSFLGPEPEDLEDLYSRYKKLQQELEFLEVQEEYIKDEQKNLKKEFLHAQEEVKRIQSIPLVIGQFLEAVDQNTAIVGSTTGSNYYVRILSTIDRELLKPNASVALHKHSNALVDVLPPEADSSIMMLTSGKGGACSWGSHGDLEDLAGSPSFALPPDQKPDVMYADIGGMDIQKQEVREAVELPLTHFELYKQIGIDPPRGVLMYGPPGCGKTMLAKAVAHHTTGEAYHPLPLPRALIFWPLRLAPCLLTLPRKWHCTVIRNIDSGVTAHVCMLLAVLASAPWAFPHSRRLISPSNCEQLMK